MALLKKATWSRIGSTMFEGITRIKPVDEEPVSTNLVRCLGVTDLTFLGVGGMVGSGVYVLVGIGARDQSGPGIIISFLLAAVITFLIAACFTEFATQVKKTGSTYQYMYVTIGEMSAFMMGFFRILTTLAAGATNGRAWSAYLDYLTDNSISTGMRKFMPVFGDYDLLTEYPDFIAGGIIMVLVFVASVGAQCSSKFNMVIAFVNLSVLLFASIVGFSQADISNWTSNSTGGPGLGDGGFLPYGWSGVLEGTGVCFWAFIGWDIIVLSAEETKNPSKTIPISMGICITGITLLYVTVASALTLMTPYSTIDSIAPLPSAMEAAGLPWAKYIVSLGPLCGLTTTLLSAIFVFIRMTYAMAEDGLIFPFFGKVNDCTKVPVMSCVCGGLLMATIAVFMDIKSIISFTVLITLFQFLIVDACVIILRYKSDTGLFQPLTKDGDEMNGDENDPERPLLCPSEKQNCKKDTKSYQLAELTIPYEKKGICENEFDSNVSEASDLVFKLEQFNTDIKNKLEQFNTDIKNSNLKPGVRKALKAMKCSSSSCVSICVLLILLVSFLAVLVLVYDHEEVMHYPPQWSVLVLLFMITVVITLLMLVICAHKQTTKLIPVKVPFLPLTPYISIMTCMVLMVYTADMTSWIGFVIVTILGSSFYLGYGAFHSKLGAPQSTTAYTVLSD